MISAQQIKAPEHDVASDSGNSRRWAMTKSTPFASNSMRGREAAKGSREADNRSKQP